ncbi:MAG: hypothetical protein GC185_08570 [Alphaproteobacteria bacterium]|nr:hypothetical protein [Alphaproteobacteria bacterium]
MPATTAETQQAEKTERLPGFFGYTRKFASGLLKDSKFWSRFNAIPNGGLFIAQGVVGGFFLLASSAPVGVVAAGLVGCAMLTTVGLYGIGYGLPRAWQSMESLCKRTFPKFNPLRAIRKSLLSFQRKAGRTKLGKKIANSPVMRHWPHLKHEHQQDIFLAALTLEGATVAGTAWAFVVAPHVMALPAVTVGGAALMGWGAWTISACLFDIYNAGKTLVQSANKWWKDRKLAKSGQKPQAAPAPKTGPQQAAKPEKPAKPEKQAKPVEPAKKSARLPADASGKFNKKSAKTTEKTAVPAAAQKKKPAPKPPKPGA